MASTLKTKNYRDLPVAGAQKMEFNEKTLPQYKENLY